MRHHHHAEPALRSLLLGACSLLTACELEPEAEGSPSTCLTVAQASPQHPRAHAFQIALQEVVDTGLPGVVMAIRDADGPWEGAAGFVDLGRQTPMATCHRTRIASVTKTFVATAIMLLVEEGRVRLDARITDYLPAERERLPNAEHITVRDLLSHQSGVHNYLDVPFALELFNRPTRTWTLEACYDHALRGAPEFSPGTDWAYSNTNYLLLGDIIESVTGAPHETFLQTRLFAPLRMASTSYAPDRFDFPGVAHGYFDLFGDHTLVDSTRTYANNCVGPDGGMVSSASDLRTFYEAVFVERTVLADASVEAMLPYVETGEATFPLYGLGVERWVDEDVEAFGHGGHEFGYRTFTYYFPEEDVTFVVWINASSLLPAPENISVTIDAARDTLRDVVLGRH